MCLMHVRMQDAPIVCWDSDAEAKDDKDLHESAGSCSQRRSRRNGAMALCRTGSKTRLQQSTHASGTGSFSFHIYIYVLSVYWFIFRNGLDIGL